MSAQSAYCTPEHMQRYREGAVEALNLARPCEDAGLRIAYLWIANTWAELADRIESELRQNS
jgi:hypothetical protein